MPGPGDRRAEVNEKPDFPSRETTLHTARSVIEWRARRRHHDELEGETVPAIGKRISKERSMHCGGACVHGLSKRDDP